MNTAQDKVGYPVSAEPIGENISLNQAADSLAWRVLDIESMVVELETLERHIHSEPKPTQAENPNMIPSDTIMGKLKQLHARLDKISNGLNSHIIFMRRITLPSENR